MTPGDLNGRINGILAWKIAGRTVVKSVNSKEARLLAGLLVEE
jgi:hypothetical protein